MVKAVGSVGVWLVAALVGCFAASMLSGAQTASATSDSREDSSALSLLPAPPPPLDRSWPSDVSPRHESRNRKRQHRDFSVLATCGDGDGCFWRETDFGGSQVSVDGSPSTCCQWFYISGSQSYWRSVKNRFGSRKLEVADQNSVVTCLDPGENRPSPGRFDRAKIGGSGTSC